MIEVIKENPWGRLTESTQVVVVCHDCACDGGMYIEGVGIILAWGVWGDVFALVIDHEECHNLTVIPNANGQMGI